MSAAEVARALHGSRNGSGFICRCPITSHGKGKGDRRPSLSIADGERGLLVKCHADCNSLDVLAELRRRGLLDDEFGGRERSMRRRLVSNAARLSNEPEPDEKAVVSWRAGAPAEGTALEEYLRARGISVDTPPSLRFLSDASYLPRVTFPAMIAAVQAPDRRIIAAQITYLDPRHPRKAPVASPRKTIGPLGHGAVRLGPAGDVLGLAEGTETALAAMQIFGLPVWASLGAGRMHNVAVPDAVQELHIFADVDEPGQTAAQRVATANAHRKVIIHSPPTGCKDWNDALAASRLVAE